MRSSPKNPFAQHFPKTACAHHLESRLVSMGSIYRSIARDTRIVVFWLKTRHDCYGIETRKTQVLQTSSWWLERILSGQTQRIMSHAYDPHLTLPHCDNSINPCIIITFFHLRVSCRSEIDSRPYGATMHRVSSLAYFQKEFVSP